MTSRALANQNVSPKLTREQARKVRSLMADEGETRAAAVAWVRAMEVDEREASNEADAARGGES
jgi:hypothetical protein